MRASKPDLNIIKLMKGGFIAGWFNWFYVANKLTSVYSICSRRASFLWGTEEY